jgi:LysM repeat protein
MKHITHIIAVSIALVVAGCATQKSSQTSAESGVYIVQSGDTLYKIAKQHQLTIKQLEDLNPDMAARLKIGQKLYVLPQASK